MKSLASCRWLGLGLLAAIFASFPAVAALPAKITGTVRDSAGRPVAGLILSVVPEYMTTSRNVKTGPKGEFELTFNVPFSSGPMRRKLCVVASDAAHNLAAAEDVDEDTTTIELKLAPATSVAGALTDIEGKPLSTGMAHLNIWVGNMGSNLRQEPARTDARGRFVINALPANRRYWLSATAPGYGSASRNFETSDSDTNRIELEPFALKVANLPLAGRVVDAEQKPATNAWVTLNGEGQPSETVQTDKAGRFKFKGVCEGSVRLFANAMSSFANTTAEAGDTNVVIVLGSNTGIVPPRPKRPALKGRQLPELASVGLSATVAPTGKPMLVCVFDVEQRPSRRVMRALADQVEAIRGKGLVVVGVQASPDTVGALKEWQAANPLPFPVGQFARETTETKWVTELESFPWLILTDKTRRVVAEGFDLDNLDAKLGELR